MGTKNTLEEYSTKDLMNEIRNSPKDYIEKLNNEYEKDLITLPQYIDLLMKKYGVSPSKLIMNTLLSKSFFYQILSGERQPGRDILLRFALVLHLPLDETQEMLTIGHKGVLYPKIRRDAAIICCIEQNMELGETNDLLESLGEHLLV